MCDWIYINLPYTYMIVTIPSDLTLYTLLAIPAIKSPLCHLLQTRKKTAEEEVQRAQKVVRDFIIIYVDSTTRMMS